MHLINLLLYLNTEVAERGETGGSQGKGSCTHLMLGCCLILLVKYVGVCHITNKVTATGQIT